MSDVVLVAASGLAREVISCLGDSSEDRVLGIVDDDPMLHGTSLLGVPVIGSVDSVRDLPQSKIVVCAGRGQSRRQIVHRLSMLGVGDDRYVSVVDRTVRIAGDCTVGVGSILLAHAALTAEVSVGRHVVAMPNVTLTHDDVIDDYVTLCAGVSLGGWVSVGAAAYLGMNSSVRERVQIGVEAVLGMGAALLTDLPAGQTWVGVPAARLLSGGPGRFNQVRALDTGARG
jgi:sugar O-acyltransferase (sialic acid O-acetyltransferase NeuD family)